jgi:hypothetical protein
MKIDLQVFVQMFIVVVLGIQLVVVLIDGGLLDAGQASAVLRRDERHPLIPYAHAVERDGEHLVFQHAAHHVDAGVHVAPRQVHVGQFGAHCQKTQSRHRHAEGTWVFT